MIEGSYNNHQLALILAVETLKKTDGVDREQASWVIEQAKKYEIFLEEIPNRSSETYEVILENQGRSIIETITSVAHLTNRNIDEARELLKYSPCSIKKGTSFEEAVLIKNQLAAIGSTSRIEKDKS